MLDSLLRELSTDLVALTTTTWLFSLLNIILIDLVMSGDNAILIGMATRKLSGKIRTKAILWGTLGATILRIVFSFGVVFLMKVPGLEFLGALLLLYVVWKFYREIRSHEWHEEQTDAKESFWGAVQMIIIADIAMSLDNVLAVAGASHGNLVNLGLGLIISIILMVVASGYIAKMLDRYPQIQWAGLFIILFTALEMLEKWFVKATPEQFSQILEQSIFSLILIAVIVTFSILQTRYLRADHSVFAEWARRNGRMLMMIIFVLLIIIVDFWSAIQSFMETHHGYRYGFLMICVLGMLEILRLRDPDQEKIDFIHRLFGRK